MAALTADVDHPHKGPLTKLAVKAIGADTFYKGALVYADAANGKAQVSVPATGDVFIGICAEQVVATAADDLVDIYVDGLWSLNVTTPAVADVGLAFFMNVDGTPTDNANDAIQPGDAALANTDILIGKLLAIDSDDSTRGWFRIDVGWIYDDAIGWI